MLRRNALIIAVMVLGMLSRNRVIVAASGIMLALDLVGLDWCCSFLELHGIEIGLVFLTCAVISPLRQPDSTLPSIAKISARLPVTAMLPGIIGGVMATIVNKQGVALLKSYPAVIIAILIGTLFGCSAMGGIPVGPLTAAGISALISELVRFLSHLPH